MVVLNSTLTLQIVDYAQTDLVNNLGSQAFLLGKLQDSLVLLRLRTYEIIQYNLVVRTAHCGGAPRRALLRALGVGEVRAALYRDRIAPWARG
jgi:hypothetical protein